VQSKFISYIYYVKERELNLNNFKIMSYIREFNRTLKENKGKELTKETIDYLKLCVRGIKSEA